MTVHRVVRALPPHAREECLRPVLDVASEMARQCGLKDDRGVLRILSAQQFDGKPRSELFERRGGFH